MSAHRAVTTSAPAFIHRFASTAAHNPLLCHHVLQQLQSARPRQMSSKRKMQTSTAYHPSTFDMPPPPPRNVGIPDTSIAGDIPQPTSRRSNTPYASQAPVRTSELVSTQQKFGLREGEAQKSRAPLPTSANTSNPTTQPRRRYNLTPLKAAIKLTPTAVAQLRSLLSQPSPKLIRVGVKNKGCSGLAYHLEYVDKPASSDEQVEQDGVKVVIDNKALFTLIGSEMDWVEDKLSQRFVFKNPNIKEQCGCGESFMV